MEELSNLPALAGGQFAYPPPTPEQYAESLAKVNEEFDLTGTDPRPLDIPTFYAFYIHRITSASDKCWTVRNNRSDRFAFALQAISGLCPM